MKTKVIYCDDNLTRLRQFPDESVDLIYLDPPFFSNRNYEVIWHDEGEIRSFEDRWEGGIEVYTAWMRERVVEMWRVLKDTGSIYLHCDYHASHYLKVMMDDIFKRSNFQNEIIWHYRRWTGKAKRFQRLHDAILFYTKGKDYTFNQLYTEYTKGSTERKMQGVLHRFKKGEEPYLVSNGNMSKKGVPENDVWHIPFVAPSAKERLGYPTQKPEALLERIIKASSRENDVVLDPFCGCATTLVVAHRLNRKWVGIDISPTACNVMKNRLQAQHVKDFTIIGLPRTIDNLKALKPLEFQNWIVVEGFSGNVRHPQVGDKGINGFTYMVHEPIQVKQSEHVGRNVIDNFETAIKRAKKSKGIIVAFSFTKGSYEEIARCKREEGLEIELVTVKSLLDKRKEK